MNQRTDRRTFLRHAVAAEDEWARCAWGLVATTEQLKTIMRPEGRIHFAGEHASAAPSWMQGALESGRRAAGEIGQVVTG
jgi:monoamine oxidase